MLTVADIKNVIDDFAPFKLAADWDNSGLQVGDNNLPVKNIYVALDTSEKIIKEAINLDCDLIITHHPLLFSSLEKITNDNPPGNLIFDLIKNNISLISAHTNIDRCEGGLNDYLAQKLSLQDINFLQQDENMNKLVVFLPEEYLDEVKFALHEVGAGKFNKYDMTGFYTDGTGTFRALEGSSPAVGDTRTYNEVDEYRLETIFPARRTDIIIKKLLQVHPYEEPAYDIIKLEQHAGELYSARQGQLADTLSLAEFIDKVKTNFDIAQLRYNGDEDKQIKDVAIACGSGSDFIGKAKINGADVFVTGDMKYHDWEKAINMGLAVIDAGHFDTEKHFKELMKKKLIDELADDPDKSAKEITIYTDTRENRPWQYK